MMGTRRPCRRKYSLIDRARLSESVRFESAGPTVSVCPAMNSLMSANLPYLSTASFTSSSDFSSLGSSLGSILKLPVAKLTSSCGM